MEKSVATLTATVQEFMEVMKKSQKSNSENLYGTSEVHVGETSQDPTPSQNVAEESGGNPPSTGEHV